MAGQLVQPLQIEVVTTTDDRAVTKQTVYETGPDDATYLRYGATLYRVDHEDGDNIVLTRLA